MGTIRRFLPISALVLDVRRCQPFAAFDRPNLSLQHGSVARPIVVILQFEFFERVGAPKHTGATGFFFFESIDRVVLFGNVVLGLGGFGFGRSGSHNVQCVVSDLSVVCVVSFVVVVDSSFR
jgi:hypothetical protein